MRILLNLHDNVTLKHVGYLLSRALKDNTLFVRHALNNIHGQSLGFLNDLLASALNTVLLIHPAFATTFVACLLHLHLHEAHVLVYSDSSSSTAFRASFGLTTLSAATLAFCTVDVPFDCEVLLHTIVEFVESDFELQLVLGSLHAIVSTTFVAFNLFLALLVIYLAFSIIG